MERQEADLRPTAGRSAPGDDTARFLHELRQLRSEAGLGCAELAARAHYPYDLIKAAEVGPSLPDLPVLSAFVRACGGTKEEWEERWRSLTRSPSLPVSATRQSGQSDAATAGARIGSAAQAGDAPDPSVIIAALNRVAEEMASPGEAEAVPAPPAAQVSPDPVPPSLSPDKPGGGNKLTGWDPIRVSAAWPALKHTPTIAEPARDAGFPGGAGVPWEPAPWSADPVNATSPAHPDGAGTSAAAASEGTAGPDAAKRSSRTMIVVAAVIVLCLLAVLLTVFA